MALQDFYGQYAPKNNSETFEEERRRIEREKLAEMQASISVPDTSIDTSAPVETPAPVESSQSEEEEVLAETPEIREEKRTWATPEISSIVNEYLGSPAEPVDRSSPIAASPIKYTKEYSLVDLDKDRHFQAVANRWLTSIGTDEDIYETLRDSDWSVTDAITRAYKSGKWTKQQKADYRYLRHKFDNASLGSFRHILEATKDIGIDIVADPLNLLAGLFIVGSGGAGVAGVSAVGRIAASNTLKEGAKKLANQKGFRAVSMGLTEGAYDAGTINAGTQLTEIQTGIRQAGTRFSGTELGLSVGLGATAGATLVGGAHKLANYMLRKEHDKIANKFDLTDELLDEKGFIDSGKVKFARKLLDIMSSNTVGKVLTKFVEDAKNKEVFRQLLLHLRHDTFRRAVIGVRGEKIEKANMTFSREADALSNTGTTFVAKALEPLRRIKEGSNFVRRFLNPNLKLANEDDLAIISLIARGNVLDKYITITPVSNNLPLHKVTSKVKQDIFKTKQMPSGLPRKDRLSEEEVSFLTQFNKNQLEAAAKLRYALQTFRRLGSDIDAIDPKTGKAFTEGKRIYDETGTAEKVSLLSIKDTDPERYAASIAFQKMNDPLMTIKQMEETEVDRLIPYSLFDPDQEIYNYFPWKWVQEAVEEKRDIIIPELAVTSHAKPDNTYVKVKGIVEGTTKGKTGRKGVERDYIEDLSTGKGETLLTGYLTKDQLYFKGLKTKNLPHIGKNGEAEEWFGKYDTFEDIAIASLEKEGIIIPTIRRTPEQQITLYTRANLYRAEALIDDLLQRETRPDYRLSYDNYTSGKGSLKTEFLNTRNWNELDEQFLIDNGFIQTDVSAIMTDYAWKIGHKIKEEKFLGYGNEFYRRYLDNIEAELGASKETRNMLNELSKVRDYATGGRLSNVALNKYQKGLYDAIKVSQVLAHLPLATLSSITEPLIALGRSDLADTPQFVKQFGKGLGKSTKKSMQRFYDHMQAARGKEVRGFRDLSDEDWLEAYRAGVATEQAMMTKIEGMFAEGIQTETARNVINTFFNINFLQQWTQGVQLGAFNFAKERSIRIIGELADDTNAYGIQLTRNSRNRRADQLREIGIEPKEGVAAYRRALDKNDIFNRDKFNEDSFYDTELIPSSALFSKEIILNPSAAELNKPMWFNNPGAAILVQFAGYPTAFNNTVLKGFARDVIRHPVANAPKVVAASGMMAGVATMMNAIRSGGESLKREKDLDIVLESFERPGLLGWGQHLLRYYEGMQYGAGPIGSGLKAISGPFGGDVIDGIAYRTPWFLIAGTNLPGYGALSPEAKRDFKKFLKRIFDKKEYDTRFNKAKGGIVLNVPNVVEEPDELKMRGQPATYSDIAGVLFQDEEERGAFAEGGKASITETDEMYSYLTKDEDAYNIQLNKNPINIYAEEELPDLEVKETYFTGFKGNTVSDRLNSVRQSTTIGLPVTTDKAKARGVVRTAGKIKFNNVLKLNIDTATPDAVQAEINKNMDSIIKIEDKVLAKEIIKATNDNLALRDDVLNKDPDRTPEKEAVIAKNKSFLVRHQLLKLSYDAIETNEGYTLLRENQFLPTEIMERSRDQYNLGGWLRKTRNAVAEGFSDIEEFIKNEPDPIPKDSQMLQAISEDKKYLNQDHNKIKQNLLIAEKTIRNMESENDWNAYQSSGGTGRGAYQFEVGTNAGAQTAITRFLRGINNDWKDKNRKKAYEKLSYSEEDLNKISTINPYSGKREAIDTGKLFFRFASLPKYLQQDIFFSNIAEEPSAILNDIDLRNNEEARDLWINNHWIGNKTAPDYKIKKQRNIERWNEMYPKGKWENVLRNIFSKGGLVSALNRRQQLGLGGRIASALKQRYKKKIPLQYRTFIDKLFLGNTDNFTEQDMTADELELYKKEIKQEIREGIKNGELFITSEGKLKSNRSVRGKSKSNREFFPSIGWQDNNLFETFGTSGLDINPANQNVKLIDQYDFRFEDQLTGPQTGTGGFTKENIMEYAKQLGFTKENINDVLNIFKNKKPIEDKPNRQSLKDIQADNPNVIVGKNPNIFSKDDALLRANLGAIKFAERYGAYTLPDKETAANINKARIEKGLPPQEFPEIKMNVNTTLDFDPEEWKSLMEQAKNNNLNRRQQYNQGGEPLTFNQQYHLETIKQKRAMRNSEGQTVTVRAEGFERDGIVYNLPTYDRRGGTIANPLEFFKEDIKSGRIQGYAADKETYSQDKNNMHLHPANIAANKEHKMMEKEVPEEVIMYEEK